MTTNVFCGALCLLAVLTWGLSVAWAAEKVDTDPKHKLTRPDDKPADMTKPVKVFILMGQSNMVGMGDIGPETTKGTLAHLTKTEKKYPFLVDDSGQWTVRKDVYYYDARVKKGGPLSPTANNGKSIGPELGFGYVIGSGQFLQYAGGEKAIVYDENWHRLAEFPVKATSATMPTGQVGVTVSTEQAGLWPWLDVQFLTSGPPVPIDVSRPMACTER
jgi:hypothetical protein